MAVSVHEAKTHLSRLLDKVATGEEVMISRRGRVVAKLVAAGTCRARSFGHDAGLFEVPEDFDAPLPEHIQKLFE